MPHTPICFLRNSCDFRDTTLDAEAGNLSDCRRICYRLRAGETRAYQPNKKIVNSDQRTLSVCVFELTKDNGSCEYYVKFGLSGLKEMECYLL